MPSGRSREHRSEERARSGSRPESRGEGSRDAGRGSIAGRNERGADRGRNRAGRYRVSILRTTPSATVGPYLAIGLAWEDGPYAVDPVPPEGVGVRGPLFEENGEPVLDGMVETWQADPD